MFVFCSLIMRMWIKWKLLKLDGTAEEALRQINDKHYARPFATDSRKLFKIGVNFSVETRNIEKWLVEINAAEFNL